MHKEGDSLTGFKIVSSEVELLKILDNLNIFQYKNYDDQRALHYARYFYKSLWEKGRENISLKLIQDLDSGNENKTDAQKHDKKQKKEK